MKEILLVTTDPDLIIKLTGMVRGFFDRIDTLQTYPTATVPVKKTQTPEETAAAKALDYSKLYNGYTLATESGNILLAPQELQTAIWGEAIALAQAGELLFSLEVDGIKENTPEIFWQRLREATQTYLKRELG